MPSPGELCQVGGRCARVEELIAQAQQERGGPALTGLLRHYRRWVAGIVVRQGRRWFFTAQELRDALEEAAGWIARAVQDYRPEARSPPCPFHRYLRVVVLARLADFHRRHCREERRFDRSADAGTVLEQWLVGAATDPADNLARDEVRDRLRHALGQLDPDDQTLLSYLLEGMSQGGIAAALGVCPKTVGRRWRQLRGRLRVLLGDLL